MIKLNSLRKTYNKASRNAVTAVNGVSLELPKTGMVALFGRSGCGKTTLLNLIGGLDRADSGSVSLGDKIITPDETDARNRNIGFIFQNYYLAESLTVEENVAASLRLCGLSDEKVIEERTEIALCAVGLEKYRRRLPQNLSGGQQQRVAIARAIVKSPEIILADEPTGNLDEANTVMIMDLLKEISKDTLVILVTHEAHLVDYYCDRVIEMSDGKIVGEKTNEETGNYSAMGKNEVYLGDMQKRRTEGDGVELEFYTKDSDEKISFSIISSGGVFYIRNETPGARIKVLDSSAELSVHEGSYEETLAKRSEQNAEKLSRITSLPPVREGKTGRMYKLSSGIKSAWRRNFDKKKRLRKVLTATMFLLSIVFVLISANCMTLLKVIDKVKANYSDNFIYIPKSSITADQLSEIKKNSKIVYPSPGYLQSMNMMYASFSGGYSSGSSYYHNYRNNMYTEAVILPERFASECKLICGRASDIGDKEIVISSATADAILESSMLSFVKTYEDVIGLRMMNNEANAGFTDAVIVGVVKNTQREVYLNDLAFCGTLLDAGTVGAHSVAASEEKAPEKGSVYIASAYEKQHPKGSKILVNGMTFTVEGYFDNGIYAEDEYYKENVYTKGYDEKVTASDVIVDVGGDPMNSYQVIMNDEDFCECALSMGESTFKSHYYYEPKNCYAIYANDVKAMKEALLSYGVSADNIHDSEYMYDSFYQMEDVDLQIVGNLTTFVIISAFISLCMFFIMRSSITSDVKEIGIYRAIGVSRKNIVFKYFVESNLIFFLTEFIGFVGTVGVIAAATSGSASVEDLMYLPWFVVLALGVFLYAISTLCGILPVTLLIKKPPAAIIAKYDI